MRTTLVLDDDVHEQALKHAKSRSVSLGRAVSELVRRGLNAEAKTRNEEGLVVFDLPADSPKVTSEAVRRLENE
jgi:hypothetical protein